MTPEEYAHGVIARANAGMFDPFSGTGLYNAIVKAIAQAVAAERERCAETARDCFLDLTDTSTMSAPDVIKRTRHGIAAAIRARSNGAGRE